jgi:phosphoglycolate phosphatase
MLLVCDLDDTLYDWFSYFVPSFYAMIDAAVDIMACDRERLLDDMKEVHQHHGDSEHPYALLETKTVSDRYPGYSRPDLARMLGPAFHAFNSSRKRRLRLYDGVSDTLDKLSLSGVTLVAHTESRVFAALDRMKRLDLLKYFKKIYCRERSESSHPDEAAASRWLGGFPLEIVQELSHHQEKPSRDVLMEICAVEDMSTGDAAYVGNSVAHDMLMAKRAGVFAVWAAYGAHPPDDLYTALVRVTHWDKEKQKKELQLRAEAASIQPDYVAWRSFSEVLAALDLMRLRAT